MLYFGDTKNGSAIMEKRDKEIRYRSEFLKHCILGLATLQHGGNMVLKVYETYTAFTVGILFVLYHLFKTVAIVKPYNSSFLSSRQYIICKGLKQRRPQQQIGYLLQMHPLLQAHSDKELVRCKGLLSFLEDEETFLTYIKNHTQALTSTQTQLFANARDEKQTYDIECFKFKSEMLRQWKVPMKQKEPKNDQRQQAQSSISDSIEKKFAEMPSEQLQAYEKDGMDLIKDIER